MKYKAYGFAVFAVLTWATAPIIFKIGCTRLTFEQAVFWFLLIGGVSLIIPRVHLLLKGNNLGLWGFALVIGIAQAIHYLSLVKALNLQDVSLTVAIVKTSTILQFIFAVILLKSKWNFKVVLGVLVCLIGVLTVIGFKVQTQATLFPILISLLAAVANGFMCIAIPKSKQDEFLVTGLSLLWGAIIVYFLTKTYGGSVAIPEGIMEWSVLIYLGIFPTAIALAGWGTALNIMKDQESKIISFEFFVPVVAAIASAIFLSEKLTYMFLMGLLVIVAGNYIISKESEKLKSQIESNQ
ncbi:MAG: DMT family transporter [bacterium]